MAWGRIGLVRVLSSPRGSFGFYLPLALSRQSASFPRPAGCRLMLLPDIGLWNDQRVAFRIDQRVSSDSAEEEVFNR